MVPPDPSGFPAVPQLSRTCRRHSALWIPRTLAAAGEFFCVKEGGVPLRRTKQNRTRFPSKYRTQIQKEEKQRLDYLNEELPIGLKPRAGLNTVHVFALATCIR